MMKYTMANIPLLIITLPYSKPTTLKLTDISNFEIKDFQGIELNINWTIREHKKQLLKADIEAIKELAVPLDVGSDTAKESAVKTPSVPV